jgi:hypothetical protein
MVHVASSTCLSFFKSPSSSFAAARTTSGSAILNSAPGSPP